MNIDKLNTSLTKLYKLGTDMPDKLVFLTQVVQPNIPDNYRIPILSQMFSEVPSFIGSIPHENLVSVFDNPPDDAVPFKLYVDLLKIQYLFFNLSPSVLYLLSDLMPSSMAPNARLSYLSQLQNTLTSLSKQKIYLIHKELNQTPIHLHKIKLTNALPELSPDVIHHILPFLKLELTELLGFNNWLSNAPGSHLVYIANLVQLGSNDLLVLKNYVEVDDENNYSNIDMSDMQLPQMNTSQFMIDPVMENSLDPYGNSNYYPTYMNDLDMFPDMMYDHEAITLMDDVDQFSYYQHTQSQIEPSVDNSMDSMDTGTVVNSYPQEVKMEEHKSSGIQLTKNREVKLDVKSPVSDSYYYVPESIFELRIQKQPPAEMVYQRNLKPPPVVMLLAPPSYTDNCNNFFIECTLLSESHVELPNVLEGTNIMRVSVGNFATFKKIKILSTSQQMKTLFKLKFQLKRYVGDTQEIIPGASIISQTIEVFSHTYYLGKKKKPIPTPKITEVLPPIGPASGGTRVVIIGSNFVNTENLLVQFGNQLLRPEFHEAGTLIFTTPPGNSGSILPVSVSNDSVEFAQSNTVFTFY
eukprot:TRINITY_DN3308_c0_g1_i1.p1 TRINITY_DN3308_c0_g1~~TRINITY_DN3308_c0_g1_i1.p1  ORF type:complete len:580 (-),score=98.46 TRINITY_DN3308_c0_g1_i1:605-2344(-)